MQPLPINTFAASAPAVRTCEITIQGLTFAAPQPYSAGHTCTEAEASVLNSVLANALRNNFARRVKEYEGTSQGDAVHIQLQREFDSYAASYTLNARTGDPIERAARRIAQDLVRTALNERGQKPSDLADGVFDSLVAKAALKPSVLSEARRRVEATKSIVEQSLDLDL